MSTATPDQSLAERAQRVASAFNGPSNTGNAIVDGIHALGMSGALQGNVIPAAWYSSIQVNGRPDYAAIMILADLTNWYRPLFDIQTGQWRAKSGQHQWTNVGLTNRALASAIVRLEKRGLVVWGESDGKEIELFVNVEALARYCEVPAGPATATLPTAPPATKTPSPQKSAWSMAISIMEQAPTPGWDETSEDLLLACIIKEVRWSWASMLLTTRFFAHDEAARAYWWWWASYAMVPRGEHPTFDAFAQFALQGEPDCVEPRPSIEYLNKLASINMTGKPRAEAVIRHRLIEWVRAHALGAALRVPLTDGITDADVQRGLLSIVKELRSEPALPL